MKAPWVPPATKRARERARKKNVEKRRAKKKVELRRIAQHKKTLKKQQEKIEAEERKQQRELDIAYRQEMKAREKEKEKAKARAKREREREKKKKEKERLKKKAEKIEKEKRARAIKKAKRHAKAIKNAKEYDKKKKKRYRMIKRRKRIRYELNHKYYDSHGGLETLRKRIAANDLPGEFIIVTVQNYEVKRTWCKRMWLNSAVNRFNKMIEENHADVMCPLDQISSSNKKTRPSVTELLLLKKINPEVEENINVFRDEMGKAVTVKTNDSNWTIARKEPWYIEEKFIVSGYNPISGKKTAHWIGKNFIEGDLSITNMKKLFLWGNFLIIDGDNDFEFAIGKTQQAARNLYMSLFKKYEKTEYVYFIGNLDSQLVWKWKAKIREKTGWENLGRGKGTYLSDPTPSKSDKNEKPIPTTSKSIKSVRSKGSSKKS